jgi:caspase domain-containing protein
MRRENFSLQVVRGIVRVASLVSILLFPALLRAQSNLAGHWEGSVSLPNKAIPIQVDFDHPDSDWHATVLFPDTAAPVCSAKSVSLEGARVHITLDMGFSSVDLDGQLSGNTIEGTFTRDDTKAKFKLARKAGEKASAASAQKRANAAPQPGPEERTTSGPTKNVGGGESSQASGPQVQAVADSAPKDSRVIRDDSGDLRGVVPSHAPTAADSDDSKPNYYALMFASDDYDAADWPHLNNPVHDARAIALELRKFYGFQTDLRENQTAQAIKDTIVLDYEKRTFKPNDELLIFFAGHGDFDEADGTGYVIAKDSSGPGSYRNNQINFDFLTKWIDRIQVQHILLVLDVCRGGSIFVQDRGGNATAPTVHDQAEALQRLSGLKTRKCMTSGGNGAVKDGRAGQGSPFAWAFEKALGEAGPGTEYTMLSLDEVSGRVKKSMRDMKNPYMPEFGSCQFDMPASDFYFFWQAPPK